jgi:hypothetical protein
VFFIVWGFDMQLIAPLEKQSSRCNKPQTETLRESRQAN